MSYIPAKDFLFFDLETTANPEMVACLPEPKAPATYRDLDKIRTYVEEARAKQVKEAALDSDCGQITTLGPRLGPPSKQRLTWLATRKLRPKPICSVSSGRA